MERLWGGRISIEILGFDGKIRKESLNRYPSTGVFVRCVCEDLYQLLFTFRPKYYEPKQRFEGSACAKNLGPDRRKVNSPRAQVKGDCLL
jgi:hypothetical protein